MSLRAPQTGDEEEQRLRPPSPLLPIAFGISCGILLDNCLLLSAWEAALFVAGGLGVFFIYRRRGAAGIAAAFLASIGVGCLRHAVADRLWPDNHIVFHTDRQPLLVRLRGRIISPVRIAEPDPSIRRAYAIGPKTRFLLEAVQIGGIDGQIDICGKVTAGIKEPAFGLRVGQVVEMTGWLYRPSGPKNPGEFDWALHLRRSGILAGISCDHAESVAVLDQEGASPNLLSWREAFRARLRGYLFDYAFEGGEPGAGVISAMVLGERSAVPRAMNEAFIKTGNAHFLAASGMHVGWLAFMVWTCLRLFGVNYRQRAVLVALLILAMLCMVEPRPSIMRAAIIGVAICVGLFRRSGSNVFNALSMAAIILLMWRPADLFRPAFQFSFLAVLALVRFQPRVAEACATWLGMRSPWPGAAWFFHKATSRKLLFAGGEEANPASLPLVILRGVLHGVVQLLLLAFSAWFVVAPLACYHFNQFTPWGALGTFLLWFIAAPTVCAGFLKLFLEIVLPSSAVVMGPMLAWLTARMIDLVQLLERVPGTIIYTQQGSLMWLLFIYLAILVWLTAPRWRAKLPGVGGRWVPAGWVLAVLPVVLFSRVLIAGRWTRANSNDVAIWSLAVGDGTGTVVELPNGKTLLYDFGTRSPFDAGQVGVRFLRHRGISRIDAAFISHANFDHYGGIEAIARQIPIDRVIISDQFDLFVEDTSASRCCLDVVAALGIPIEVMRGPQRFEFGDDVVVETIWPPAAEDDRAPNANDGSSVLRIEHEGKSVLLTGDITEWGIGGLLAAGCPKADVLVLPHHGSVVHNTGAFIGAVDPAIAIRSTGQRRAMTTNDIETIIGDRAYFSTADDGCVVVTIGGGIVRTERAMRHRGDP